jgi:hypothetical protein
MKIAVTVYLAHDETLAYPPDEAAKSVLSALDGDETKDACDLSIVAEPTPGHAGVLPE